MLGRIIPSQVWVALVAALVALLLLGATWLRWDAVDDFKGDLGGKALEHVKDAREIENATDTDTDTFECLRGIRC